MIHTDVFPPGFKGATRRLQYVVYPRLQIMSNGRERKRERWLETENIRSTIRVYFECFVECIMYSDSTTAVSDHIQDSGRRGTRCSPKDTDERCVEKLDNNDVAFQSYTSFFHHVSPFCGLLWVKFLCSCFSVSFPHRTNVYWSRVQVRQHVLRSTMYVTKALPLSGGFS